MDDREQRQPESLLPYDDWAEEAQRLVVARALQRVAREGLPGDHHFYLTFRTDHPGVTVPARLRAQYPQEMTIVLQHQFWDLTVDEAQDRFSVGLSFAGVPTTLTIPFAALSAFADPQVRFGLRFRPAPPSAEAQPTGPRPSLAVVPAAGAATPQATSRETPQDTSQETPQETPQGTPQGTPQETPQETPGQTPQVVSLDAFRRRPTPKE